MADGKMVHQKQRVGEARAAVGDDVVSLLPDGIPGGTGATMGPAESPHAAGGRDGPPKAFKTFDAVASEQNLVSTLSSTAPRANITNNITNEDDEDDGHCFRAAHILPVVECLVSFSVRRFQKILMM